MSPRPKRSSEQEVRSDADCMSKLEQSLVRRSKRLRTCQSARSSTEVGSSVTLSQSRKTQAATPYDVAPATHDPRVQSKACSEVQPSVADTLSSASNSNQPIERRLQELATRCASIARELESPQCLSKVPVQKKEIFLTLVEELEQANCDILTVYREELKSVHSRLLEKLKSLLYIVQKVPSLSWVFEKISQFASDLRSFWESDLKRYVGSSTSLRDDAVGSTPLYDPEIVPPAPDNDNTDSSASTSNQSKQDRLKELVARCTTITKELVSPECVSNVPVTKRKGFLMLVKEVGHANRRVFYAAHEELSSKLTSLREKLVFLLDEVEAVPGLVGLFERISQLTLDLTSFWASDLKDYVGSSTFLRDGAVGSTPLYDPEIVPPPPDNDNTDSWGRYKEERYRKHAIISAFCAEWMRGSSSHQFDPSSVDKLDGLLEYVWTKRGESQNLDAGSFIEGDFLDIFEAQNPVDFCSSGLYVRQCYVDFRKRLMAAAAEVDNDPRGLRRFSWLLTGNPGIGKSTLLVHHLIELLYECRFSSNPNGDLKVLLTKGKRYYAYTRLAGWFQVSHKSFETLYESVVNKDAWLLADSFDIANPHPRKTLSVSSPNKRHYRLFLKRRPTRMYLPTWQWDEILALFRLLVGRAIVALRFIWERDGNSIETFSDSYDVTKLFKLDAPKIVEDIERNDPLSEFYSPDLNLPVPTEFYLDEARLSRRFEIWGGVPGTILSTSALGGLEKILVEQRKQLAKFFHGAEYDSESGVMEKSENIIHAVLQFRISEFFHLGGYIPISEIAGNRFLEFLSSYDWMVLRGQLKRGVDVPGLFEQMCHKMFICSDTQTRPTVYLRPEELYGRDLGQVTILELPLAKDRVFQGEISTQLRAVRNEMSSAELRMIYLRPGDPQHPGLDAYLCPGIVLQCTISPQRNSEKLPALRSMLSKVLAEWGLPPLGHRYVLAYVVPDTNFKGFTQIGLTSGRDVELRLPCDCVQSACSSCSLKHFDVMVMGVPGIAPYPISERYFSSGTSLGNTVVDGDGRFVTTYSHLGTGITAVEVGTGSTNVDV